MTLTDTTAAATGGGEAKGTGGEGDETNATSGFSSRRGSNRGGSCWSEHSLFGAETTAAEGHRSRGRIAISSNRAAATASAKQAARHNSERPAAGAHTSHPVSLTVNPDTLYGCQCDSWLFLIEALHLLLQDSQTAAVASFADAGTVASEQQAVDVPSSSSILEDSIAATMGVKKLGALLKAKHSASTSTSTSTSGTWRTEAVAQRRDERVAAPQGDISQQQHPQSSHLVALPMSDTLEDTVEDALFSYPLGSFETKPVEDDTRSPSADLSSSNKTPYVILAAARSVLRPR